MSLDPTKLDIWLSAHLDGQLDEQEKVRLDEELEHNAEARSRLEDLSSVRSELKGFFASQPSESLSQDFAARVTAAALESRAGRTADATVAREVTAARGVTAGEKTNAKWWQVASALALAGAILVAVSLPTWLIDPQATDGLAREDSAVSMAGENTLASAEDPGLQLATSDPDTVESDAVQYVGEIQFPALQYVLIVDVTLSQQAMDNGALQKVFAEAGIPTAAPIIATQRLNKLVSEARMTVVAEEESDSDGEIAKSESWLFYVRAPMVDLGRALDVVYKDQTQFPVVTLDLGYQTARSELLRAVASSTKNRFRIDESFAASVKLSGEATETEGSDVSSERVNPFRESTQFETPLPKNFVAKSARQSGFQSTPSSSGENLENLLLYVRVTAD